MADAGDDTKSAAESLERYGQSDRSKNEQEVQIVDSENASESDRSADTNEMDDSSSEAQPRSRSQSVSQPDSDQQHFDFEPPRPRSISTPVTKEEEAQITIKGIVPIANRLADAIQRKINECNTDIEKYTALCPPKIQQEGDHLFQQKETVGMFGNKSSTKSKIKFKKVRKIYEELQTKLRDEDTSQLPSQIKDAISNFKMANITCSEEENAFDEGMSKQVAKLFKSGMQHAAKSSYENMARMSTEARKGVGRFAGSATKKALKQFPLTDIVRRLENDDNLQIPIPGLCTIKVKEGPLGINMGTSDNVTKLGWVQNGVFPLLFRFTCAESSARPA